MAASSVSTDEFPGNKVWVYKQCVSESVLVAVRELATAYEQAPDYWLPRELVDKDCQDQLLTPAEIAINQLYHSVIKEHLPESCTGAEWWVYEGGSGLAFHFDKDEQLLEQDGTMKHPLYASIIYLSGSDEDRLRQACTVILDQRFDSQKGEPDPESPTSCVFVPPSMGKCCVFDGGLGHGVMDSSSLEWRATLLVNWWATQPKGVHRPTSEELQQLCLPNQSRRMSQILFSPPIPHPSAIRSQYPSIRLPTEDEDVKESGILMDDLLDAYLLDAFGEKAIQAVSVWHGSHILYPIDPLKTKQDISKKLIIPAAFIPEDVDVKQT